MIYDYFIPSILSLIFLRSFPELFFKTSIFLFIIFISLMFSTFTYADLQEIFAFSRIIISICHEFIYFAIIIITFLIILLCLFCFLFQNGKLNYLFQHLYL